MSASGFLRLGKVNRSTGLLGAARHNRRKLTGEKVPPGNINAFKSHLNETLHGPATPEGVDELARGLMRRAGITKLRKDAVMAIEAIFSLPPSSPVVSDRAYFEDCWHWAANRFGGFENVLSVDIHRDESAPHCHVLILPLREGRMVGSAMMGCRRQLLAMQAAFFQEVAQGYGLKRSPAKLTGDAKARAVGSVLKYLKNQNDPVQRSSVWAVVRDTIAANPGPYLEALGIQGGPPPGARPLKCTTPISPSPGAVAGWAPEPLQPGRLASNPIGFQNPIGFALAPSGKPYPV